MAKKKRTKEPLENPLPAEAPEIQPGKTPENPALPDEEPEAVPDEEIRVNHLRKFLQ